MRATGEPRVLHVVPRLLDEEGRLAGGGERYPLELARHMGARVHTRLISFGPRSFADHIEGVPLRIFGGDWAARGRANNPFSPRAAEEVLQADAVHCHQREVMISKWAALTARLAGRRIAVTDHGGGAWDWTSRLPASRLFEDHLHVSRFSLRIAGHEGLPRARVILAGVDAAKFSPGRGAAPGPRRVVYVGRLLPHKGVDDLIAALPDGLGLDVIGPVVDERYMRDLRELASGRDVQFRHGLDDRALVDAYRGALCVVLPSKYRDRYGGETAVPELLGQTLLEGMACGRPVVCTEVGGMPEVVVDGSTGFVVPPGDADELRRRIGWLAGQEDQADRMGEAARRRVLDEFTWNRVVDRCLAVYGAPRS